MAQPPFNDLRLKPGERPDQKRLETLFEGIQTNFENAWQQFAGTTNVAELKKFVEGSFMRSALAGNHKHSFGSSTLNFAASTASGITTINHGLGASPLSVTAVALGSPEFGKIPNINVSGSNATTISFNAEIKTAHTGAIGFMWMADA